MEWQLCGSVVSAADVTQETAELTGKLLTLSQFNPLHTFITQFPGVLNDLLVYAWGCAFVSSCQYLPYVLCISCFAPFHCTSL